MVTDGTASPVGFSPRTRNLELLHLQQQLKKKSLAGYFHIYHSSFIKYSVIIRFSTLSLKVGMLLAIWGVFEDVLFILFNLYFTFFHSYSQSQCCGQDTSLDHYHTVITHITWKDTRCHLCDCVCSPPSCRSRRGHSTE